MSQEPLNVKRPAGGTDGPQGNRCKELGAMSIVIQNGHRVERSAFALAGQAAERGWHVFPVPPGAKGGLVSVHEATTDAARIQSWWRTTPDANYGIHPAPSGLYVVDLDVKGGVDGVAAWEALQAKHGQAGRSYTVRTPSGGLHIYFRAPADCSRLRNTNGSIAPGIDTRYRGGHVVGPGSAIDGRAYEVVDDVEPAPMPQWLVTAQAKQESPVVAVTTKIIASDGTEARVQALADELASAPDGQGNATAARVAYMAGQYVGAGQISHEEALDIFLGALRGWTWRSEADARQMVQTIQAQLRAGAENERPWDDWSGTEIVLVDHSQEEEEEEEQKPSHRLDALLLDWNDLWDVEPTVPLIEGVLDQGTVAMLAGKFGTYKSFLALDWAAHVATGNDWNGHRVPEAHRVMYVAAEGFRGVRQRAMAWAVAHQPIERGKVVILPVSVRLTTIDDVNWLDKRITELDIALVVLDTLHCSIPGADEQSSTDMGKILDLVRTLIERHPKLCVLMVHHTGHAGERARGSSALEDDVDTSFVIKLGLDGKSEDRGPNTARVLHHRKAKDGELLEPRGLELELVEGTDSGVLRAPDDQRGSGAFFQLIDPVQKVVQALEAAGQGRLGRAKLQQWCSEQNPVVPCSERTARQVIARGWNSTQGAG